MKMDIIDTKIKGKAFSTVGFLLLTVAVIAILFLNVLNLIALF